MFHSLFLLSIVYEKSVFMSVLFCARGRVDSDTQGLGAVQVHIFHGVEARLGQFLLVLSKERYCQEKQAEH